MVTVLNPVEMAERCYLSEALFYLAFDRLPLSFVTDNDIDARLDYDWHGGDLFEPFLPGGHGVTEAECKAAGLEPDPGILLETLRKGFDEPLDSTASATERRRRQRHETWIAKFQEFLDDYRLKLIKPLLEGRLRALGKKLPGNPKISAVKEWGLKNDYWDIPWEPIPAKFWAAPMIDWYMCYAEGWGATHVLIQVYTDDLFSEFPIPSSGVARDVKQMGDNFVLLDSTQISSGTKLGRPALKWDEFYLEVAKRLQNGALPQKQESFISEMENWCRNQWGREVARSTLLGKIKPYYDTFVRSKKSKNDL